KKKKKKHNEVQKEFYQWIDAVGIKAENCPKKLNHHLFTINEVLEGRGKDFVNQTDEKNDSGSKPKPQTYEEVYRLMERELNNPNKRKEINIKGNAETGKEIFQQISNSISTSDRQKFRFYTHDQNDKKPNNSPTDDNDNSPSPNSNPKTQKNDNQKFSWLIKIIIGGIILLGLIILIWLIVKSKKRNLPKKQK
ncbi:MAG: hypothetical protein I3273_07515, partial [Candidatus Moeniiplasma glomeromycotorum]|nr:hypothetical protein [Candidatus Moeniiplasma glomeromycotorum]MCE8169935.1 hypothetical protein [Candidatus Moeniiplasma glomeromycotorum]